MFVNSNSEVRLCHIRFIYMSLGAIPRTLKTRKQLHYIIMKFVILHVFVISMTSCQQAEPKLSWGKANVRVTDGELNDTLSLCYCWQAEDSLNIHITRGPYIGISIDVTGKNNLYQSLVGYYSDTNEFNGQFDLNVPVSNDSLNISFENIGDSIRISGYVEVESKPIKFYGDGRIIEGSGTFNCMIATQD